MKREPGFAVWITGLPGSGKSTITKALVDRLERRGVAVAVLESDTLRASLMPDAGFDEASRDRFYGAMVWIGELLTGHGVPVIFDATATRRRYRDRARNRIERFVEVYVNCPLEVCIGRDPKGIYRRGREGRIADVPGLDTPYEAPERPDVVVPGRDEDPDAAADRILAALAVQGCIAP